MSNDFEYRFECKEWLGDQYKVILDVKSKLGYYYEEDHIPRIFAKLNIHNNVEIALIKDIARKQYNCFINTVPRDRIMFLFNEKEDCERFINDILDPLFISLKLTEEIN